MRLRYIIPPMSPIPPMPPAMPAPAFSGGSATIASVMRMFFAIEAAFCSAERVTIVGSMMPALALGGSAYLVHDDRALEPCVVGELAERLLERADDDLRARALIRIVEAVQLDRLGRVQERDTAARDDALLERGPSCLQRVLDAVLLLLHLGLGRSADLDDGHPAGQLREPLLELLAVEVGVGVLDLRLQLLDAALDRVGVAGTVDDRRRVLVDDH